MERKRQGYIHELIQTEERYVSDLQLVVEVSVARLGLGQDPWNTHTNTHTPLFGGPGHHTYHLFSPQASRSTEVGCCRAGRTKAQGIK